jgi:hypothetical protein
MGGIVRFSAGSLHVLGLKADGSLWGWGDDQFGELGTGSFSDKTFGPTKISLDGPDPGTALPAGTPDISETSEPAPQEGSSPHYLQYGIIVLMCLIAGACALIWYSRR